MKYRNRVEIIGRLGADPEVIELSTGTAVNIVVYTNMPYVKNGETHYHSERHPVSIYGRHAAYAVKALRKGKTVLLEGKLRGRHVTLEGGKQLLIQDFVISERGHQIMLLDTPTQSEEVAQAQPQAVAQAQPQAVAQAPAYLSEQSSNQSVGGLPKLSRYAPPPEPHWDEPDPF